MINTNIYTTKAAICDNLHYPYMTEATKCHTRLHSTAQQHLSKRACIRACLLQWAAAPVTHTMRYSCYLTAALAHSPFGARARSLPCS